MKIHVPAHRISRCAYVGKKTLRENVITRKPILPSEEELEENKRAKSAKLRVFERRR